MGKIMKKIESMMVAWERFHNSDFNWIFVDDPIRSVDSMIDAWKKNNGVVIPEQQRNYYTYKTMPTTATSYCSSTSSTYTVWYD